MNFLRRFIPQTTKSRSFLHPGAFISSKPELPLPEWLPHFRASAHQTKYVSLDLSMHQVPWIWIIKSPTDGNAVVADEQTFVTEGNVILEKMLANEGGDRSTILSQFYKDLDSLSDRTNVKSGKFICRIPTESIDSIFDSIALSLFDENNPMSSITIHSLKVSTMEKARGIHEMHILSSSSDKPDVIEMAELLFKMSVVPLGYETDAQTLLGVDSNWIIPSPRYSIKDLLSPEVLAASETV